MIPIYAAIGTHQNIYSYSHLDSPDISGIFPDGAVTGKFPHVGHIKDRLIGPFIFDSI